MPYSDPKARRAYQRTIARERSRARKIYQAALHIASVPRAERNKLMGAFWRLCNMELDWRFAQGMKPPEWPEQAEEQLYRELRESK